jgi:hypothetical protein
MWTVLLLAPSVWDCVPVYRGHNDCMIEEPVTSRLSYLQQYRSRPYPLQCSGWHDPGTCATSPNPAQFADWKGQVQSVVGSWVERRDWMVQGHSPQVGCLPWTAGSDPSERLWYSLVGLAGG